MSAIKLGKWHLSLAIVFLILGVLLSTSFYTQRKLDLTPGPRKQRLIDFVKGQERQRQRMEYELKILRTRVARLQKQAAAQQGEMGTFGKEMDKIKDQAGLTPVEGPGIEVSVNDAANVPDDRDPNAYLIHDYDLQIIVNALWRGGAEAIAINGQRFISTTSVRCAGATVMVNAEPLGGPYRVRAIGDQLKMEQQLDRDPDAKQFLNSYAKTYGIRISIQKIDDLSIPAYKGSLRFDSIKMVNQ